MLKKAYPERSVVSDGWISLDPADIGLIESVYKKTLREGEERLMLAVLENAVEYFQKYVLARKSKGKQLFHFWIKTATRFTPLKASAKPSGCIPTTYGRV